MTNTKIFEKLSASIINTALVIAISLPLGVYWHFDTRWKLSCISIFFIYELVLLFTKEKRDLGMIVVGSYWRKPFNNRQYVVFNILYTASFATLFFQIWFVLDLLLINLALIQLLCIKITGATLHGYISGMSTQKES